MTEDQTPTSSSESLEKALGAAGSAWTARVARRRAAENALLVSDAERDAAAGQLSEAFAQGRLSAAELDTRTSAALAARTRGDLDAVLRDLGGWRPQVRSHPVRLAVVGFVALLCSPFALMGVLLFLFGSDAGDHVAGLVLLVPLLPGLLALWRWARPRG
ncbi:MAG: DUF1707 SHOCT-like domain-containing protein [Nocardioides sp.]